MATHIGNEGVVKIGANTVAEVTGFTINEKAATADDSQLSDTADTHKVGSTSWDADVDCFWDETDTNGQVAMTIGASVTLNAYPEGADTGDKYYTGTATIVDKSLPVTRNAITRQSFKLQGNGALTLSTA